ncbi:MAG: ribose 5-phosphate isomerase B [Lachnospiraceae bacterium]|nr:ribose 5-phosphate isomerase B [Lachnospiraceae bacterium]MDY5639589.1 ribose 5-phosphate isomerase B [Lachnospiraceae bacterium]
MKVSIGCDHGGYDLKEKVKAHLIEKGIEVVDFGTNDLSSCDYPDFGIEAAKAVANNEVDKGIVICTTGIGISIAANKVKGIRCALCSDLTSARLTREHNDANVLALGAAIIGHLVALDIVDVFLSTAFSGLTKHSRRIEKIKAQEENF